MDLNGTQAAIRAGYSAKTAAEQSYDLLRRPQIGAAIARAVLPSKSARISRLMRCCCRLPRLPLLIPASWSKPAWAAAVTVGERTSSASARWSQRNADFEKWRAANKPVEEFDEEGGIGFNPHRPPHPDCTECCGDGVSRDVIKDARYLSPAAAQLYAGVKRTKDGLQVLMHDKATFAEKLWKHLGLYEKDNGQKNDPLALRNLTDAERAVRMSAVLEANPGLAALFGQIMSGGAQQ